MEQWAFDTLGIEVTKDEKLIKKAYSALVKKYHPEEYPEEWSNIHEAYQAAMQYAQKAEKRSKATEYWDGLLEEEGQIEYEYEDEIWQENSYDEMFEEAWENWSERKSEKVRVLAKRLDELVHAPIAIAEYEWKQFFAAEFLPDVQPDELLMLFEAIRGNNIPANAAKIIVVTMIKRKELYKSSMEFNKAALADGIINCVYQKEPKMEKAAKRKKKGTKKILKEMLIGAGAAVLIVAILILITAGAGIRQAKITDMAVRQLNEKYGADIYSEEDIDIEEDELYGSGAETLISYQVTEKGTEDTIAYLLGKKEDEEQLLCFDRLQSAEIKQALETDINERTGQSEGKLYWDSVGGGAECIKDGYFHEKYEDSIGEFLMLETKARETVTGPGDVVEGVLPAKNGKADYYIPDKNIQTMKQRMELKKGKGDEAFTQILGQCASDYDIQVCCSVLPEISFEKRMERADWKEGGIAVRSMIHSTGMYSSLSFLLMTGWYVCLPSYGQEHLKVKNGMYSGELVNMAKGIWGIENKVNPRGKMDAPILPEGRALEIVKAPKSLGISAAKGQKEVSFRLSEGSRLEENYSLAIDKAVYNIPDSGYRVMLTTYHDGNEETMEDALVSYDEPGKDIGYGDSLDGEGYLFTGYPRSRSGEENAVLTIIF